VLANAKDPVDADLYLLTDSRPRSGEELSVFGIGDSSVGDTLPGAPGFVLQQQEPMNRQLHDDLASDRNMSWVPREGWVTHLTLQAASPTVDYDMSVAGDGAIRLASLGVGPVASATQPPAARFTPHPHITSSSVATIAAVAAGGLLLAALTLATWLRRRRMA
jgi:hypothetical protein